MIKKAHFNTNAVYFNTGFTEGINYKHMRDFFQTSLPVRLFVY